MPKYLVPCACGKQLSVDASLAGRRVTCTCGTAFDAPTLSRLRGFPLDSQPAGAAATTGGWGLRQGLLAAGVLVGLLLGGAGAYCWRLEPAPPEGFDAAGRAATIQRRLESLRPAEAFGLWVNLYVPMQGAGEFIDPEKQARLERIADLRLYRWAFWGVGAASVAGLVAAAVATGGGAHRAEAR